MENLQKEFCTYSQALRLKALGFDEPCFGRFYIKPKCKVFSVDEKGRHYQIKNTPKKLYTIGEHFVLNDDNAITAPTFSQCFRWFREKYNLHQSIIKYSGSKIYWCQIEMISDKKDKSGEYEVIYATSLSTFTKYQDAELACLEKLLEIVESKSE